MQVERWSVHSKVEKWQSRGGIVVEGEGMRIASSACPQPLRLPHCPHNIIINVIISLNSGTPKISNSESTVRPTVLELKKKELLIF